MKPMNTNHKVPPFTPSSFLTHIKLPFSFTPNTTFLKFPLSYNLMALSSNLLPLFFLAMLLICALNGMCHASRRMLDDVKKPPSTVQLAFKSPISSRPSKSNNVTRFFSFPAIPKIPTLPTFPFIPNSIPLVPLPPGFEISVSDSVLLTDEKKPSDSNSP